MADLISTIQAAQEFGLHPETVRRMIHSGRIKGYRKPFSNYYLVDRADLRALAEPRQVPAKTGGPSQTVMPLDQALHESEKRSRAKRRRKAKGV